MAFVKVVKNNAYFKRYQVKSRRRKENKTDYFARRMLVKQDKNKYNTPKYRMVVRITNSKVITQVIWATIEGDRVLAQALSTELPRYGVKCGLKNYSAAYATGLLLARRTLNKLSLDKEFEGVAAADGEEYHVEEEIDERRAFKAVLDVGMARTSIGARIFGALKGAVDGGMHVPHSIKRFPGFTAAEEKGAEDEYDAAVHRDRIMGVHVGKYMTELADEDKARYERQFSKFIKAGLKGDKMEEVYKKCHEAIRKDPTAAAKKAPAKKNVVKGNKVITNSGKVYIRHQKLSLKQRHDKVHQKIRAAQLRAANADE